MFSRQVLCVDDRDSTGGEFLSIRNFITGYDLPWEFDHGGGVSAAEPAQQDAKDKAEGSFTLQRSYLTLCVA